jgi:glycerophosphoryl diester phosphodiesterase
VECDVQATSDGRLVVLHDATLDRTTDAVARGFEPGRRVDATTAEDLSALDAGSWFHPRFAEERIPALADVLTTVTPERVLVVERKSGPPEAFRDAFARTGTLASVVVISFDWEFIVRLRALEPALLAGPLWHERWDAASLARLEALGAPLVGANQQHLTPDLVARLRRPDRRLWSYTVDDPVRATALLSAGLDGLITNRPRELAPLVRQP